MVKRLTSILILMQTFFVFAQGSLFTEIYNNSRLEISAESQVNFDDLANYSFMNAGLKTGFSTKLTSFGKKSKNSFGTEAFFLYHNRFTTRPDINTFYDLSVISGLWLDFALPNNFTLELNSDAGMAFTKFSGQNVNGKKMDDIYNAIVIHGGACVYKPFAQSSGFIFNWKAGCDFNYFFEKSSQYFNAGINAGILINLNNK